MTNSAYWPCEIRRAHDSRGIHSGDAMRFPIRTSWACAVLVASACAHDATTVAATVVRDSAGVRIVESSGPTLGPGDSTFARLDSAPVLSIGVEEGEEAYQLHRVTDALRLADGRIAVSNSGTQEIRVYDSTGRYLKSVGRKGSGPGEFAEFSSATLYPVADSVLALDNGAFRLHLFGPDLTFIQTRPFVLSDAARRPFMTGVFSDGSWFAFAYENGGALNGPPGTVLRTRYSLLRYDAKGALVNTIVAGLEARARYVLQSENFITFPYIPLTASPLHAASDSLVLLLRGTKPELEVYDESGRLTRLIRWQRPQVRTADVWERYRKDELSGMTNARDSAVYGKLFSVDLPLPEFVPLYDRMLVDTGRRVWLRRFRLSREKGPYVWDVLSGDGTWLGGAATPRDFTPYRIGGDHMMGVRRDSLGVERVQVMRMHVQASGR